MLLSSVMRELIEGMMVQCVCCDIAANMNVFAASVRSFLLLCGGLLAMILGVCRTCLYFSIWYA